MLQLGLLVIAVLLLSYLFHWKFLTLISAIFCYFMWKDWTSAHPPKLCYQTSSPLCQKVVRACQILQEKYSPPIWGKYGHVQTLMYGLRGRFGYIKQFTEDRRSVVAVDGSTVYYNMFHPDDHTTDQHYTHIMLVCPGIGSHSGARYLQSLVQHATGHGYCVAIMNHVGALGCTLTGNRIFSYGGTGDLALTYEQLKKEFPGCKFIGVGYSLGANILLKFLAERPERQDDFACAISICQGYDPVRALLAFKAGWKSFYNIGITKGVLDMIGRHHHQLFPRDTPLVDRTRHSFLRKFTNLISGLTFILSSNSQAMSDDTPSPVDRDYEQLITSHDCNGFSLDQSSCEPVNMEGFCKAQIIQQLDEHYTRRVMGFRSVRELYKWSSCAVLLQKIRSLPVLLVNARDDPVVMESLLSIPADYTKLNHNAIFLCTEHGGHLGFFEGGLIIPDTTSWIDRLVVDYTKAVLQYSN